jgi:outer membrane autotransporter protein
MDWFSRFDILHLRRQSTAFLLVNFSYKTICSNPWIISRRKARVLGALLAGLCLGGFTAHANPFFWQRDSGGDWFGNGNWSGGPHPTSFSDTATFTKNNDPGSPAPAPVNLLNAPPEVPTIGTLNLNVGGYTFQNGTLRLGGLQILGGATINVQSHNSFDDFATSATIQLFNNATINTSLANSTLRVAGGITGNFGSTKTGPGELTLSGTNTYTGNTAVTAGNLLVNGSLGAGSVNVSSGATLGGTGTIGGPVTIQSGGILSPGVSFVPGTLTMGSLTLNSGSILNYDFGIPNVVNSGINDLVIVMGNLTLAGTLNVTDVGGFEAGVYRVFNYSGSLTNNTLNLGSLPSGFGFSVDTAHANQVNLIVSGGLPDQFWDGSNTTPGSIAFGRGGNGTWNNVTTNTNWTTEDGTHNAAWGNGFAIFAGTAGTVTLGDNIHFTGMQFLTNGYLIEAPGSQTLLAAPDTKIRTDVGVTATISAPIANDSAGPAKLTKSDAGTLVLVGNNTYTGGTTIEAGTLQLGNGGTTGSIIGDIVDDGMLAISRSDSFTFGGSISGMGSLTQIGPGTLVLTAANSYTGDTIINGGILSIATAANIGATNSLTFNGGTLLTTGNVTTPVPVILNANGTIDNGGNTDTFSGVFSGAGGLISKGAGTLILTADNEYTGDTVIAAGTLQLGSGGPTGVVVGNIQNNAALVIDHNNTVTIPGMISGTGSLTQLGPGTTILTGDNTYSGGTTISAGTLQLGNGGTTGNITGNVTDNGTLAFNRIDAVTFQGLISGTGSVLQAGTGTTILTADNTYSGGTTISGGTLQLGDGGATGSIVGNVTDNGTLAFNHSGDKKTFAGVISGTGSVVKLGSDILVLTANNTYGGGTTIEAGTLVAGAPSAAQEISNALGTGDVFLQGGTLRTPSLDPLTINVGHNYTQGPAGTLALGVAGVNGEDYDHVQVGGNASLNGTLAVTSLNNFRPVDGNAFEVLRSNGSRRGQFATITDFLNNNPNLQLVEILAPNGVALAYVAATTPLPTPTPTPPGPTPSPTPNPRPPIIDVEPNPLPPVNPEEPLPISFLLAALDPTAEQLSAIYEIGFSQANTQRFKLDERFDDIQRGSTGFVSNLPPAPAPVTATGTGKEVVSKQSVPPPPRPENRWGVWANGWGDWVSVSNDGSTQGYDFTTGGFIIGVDYRITDHFAVGLMGGYAHTATNLRPSGGIDVNTGRGGLYATYFDHGFYINAATYGGYNSYSTSRQGLLGMANGSTNSGEFSIWTEAGYDFHFGDFTVGPMGALQYALVHVDGFSEQGSLLPLQIHSDQEASLRTDLGARATYTWHLGSVAIIPTLTVAWEHEYFYSALPVTVSSVEFPGQSATLFGPAEGHDSAIINAGAAFQLTPRLSTYLGYQGQLGRNHYNANAITGGFSFSF